MEDASCRLLLARVFNRNKKNPAYFCSNDTINNMQEVKKDKVKIKNLEEKLRETRKENRELRQKNKELKDSRHNWKNKSKIRLKALRSCEKELKKCSMCHDVRFSKKPLGYQYSSTIICLVIWVRTWCNCSLRGCVKLLEILVELLGLPLSRIPCASTIYYWECKLGNHRLTKEPAKKSTWTVIVDESITIAQQRLLLILGVQMENYDFEGPLSFSDVSVLYLGVRRSWTELCIWEQIRHLQEKGYHFVNSVSDGGSAIVKALKASQIDRVSDCTHELGNILKRQYKKSEEYKSFIGLCGRLKKEIMNGPCTYLIPPTQRVKGRFLNLYEMSDWAFCMVRSLERDILGGINSKILNKLNQLLVYRELIYQIYYQCQASKKLNHVLKTEGLSVQSKEKGLQLLQASRADSYFKESASAYLEENIRPDEQLICCSDIIESIFGKLKNGLSKNKMNGFGLSCLKIANITDSFTTAEIIIAMEKTSMLQLKFWAKENLSPNVMATRRNWLKNARENFYAA